MLDAESRELLALSTDGSRHVRFVTEVASDADQVLDALRLRHRVFVGEMKVDARSGGGLEYDLFARYCDHLIVRDAVYGRVVGAYRMLGCEAAHAAGGFYSETEFDLGPLRRLPGRLLEV